MKKKNFHPYTALSLLCAITLTGCNKDDNNASSGGTTAQKTTTNSANALITMHISSGAEDSYFTLIDPDSYLWNWKCFNQNNFVFDQDVYTENPDSAISDIHVVDSTTIHIDYASGNTIDLTNVMSVGNTTTLSILADNNSTIQISVTFPQDVDLIELTKANNAIDTRIPMPLIFAAACLAVTIYDGIQWIDCLYDKKMPQNGANQMVAPLCFTATALTA